MAQKQTANNWRQIELVYSRQLFHQLFRVGKLESEVWTIGKDVLVTVNQSKHALYSRDLFAWHFTKWWTQVNTFKFIEEVRNCPAVWDVSSITYKDTENKQKKMEELEDKLGLVQTFLFLRRFLLLLLSSSISLFYTWVPLH